MRIACPYCKKDSVIELQPDHWACLAFHGSLPALCMHCGEVIVFQFQLLPTKPTEEEQRRIETSVEWKQEVQAKQEAIKRARRAKNARNN